MVWLPFQRLKNLSNMRPMPLKVSLNTLRVFLNRVERFFEQKVKGHIQRDIWSNLATFSTFEKPLKYQCKPLRSVFKRICSVFK
jgi:hypothetical protein